MRKRLRRGSYRCVVHENTNIIYGCCMKISGLNPKTKTELGRIDLRCRTTGIPPVACATIRRVCIRSRPNCRAGFVVGAGSRRASYYSHPTTAPF